MSPGRLPDPVVVAGDGVALALRTWGDREAPVAVLLHGFPDTGAMWAPVAAALAADHYVVAPDTRGAGASEAPDSVDGYRFGPLLADLEAVLDATAGERAVHLVGHDWGSILGWEAVRTERFAGRIASFTSLSGPPLDHATARLRARATPGRLRQALASSYVPWFMVPVAAPAVWRAVAHRGFARLARRIDAPANGGGWPTATLAADGARGMNLYRANIGAAARAATTRRTDVPVLLVVAEADRFVGPAYLDDVEAIAPALDRVTVAGGHWAPRSHPGEVAALVAGHVAAHC